MKLTKKLELTVLKIYNAYWESYLQGDMKTFASLLEEHCHIIGSTKFDVFADKKSAVEFYSKTAEQITGKGDLRNRKITVLPSNENVMVEEFCDFYFLSKDEWHFYGHCRLSTLFSKKENSWKIIYQHGSMPDSKAQEGKQIAAKEIAEENKKLRNAIKRRTVELESKNRELEIEASLERVRARTIAMQKSTELADTASVLFQQIKGLGFEIWSCGFCTWKKNDIAEVWMGADSGGLLPPMIIPYKKEPTHYDIYKASLSGVDSHEKIWEGKALEKHYDFLHTLPSVASAIKQLEDAGLSLPTKQCYYIGFFKQGYLLLITKESNAEMRDISKHFAKVFDQAYTRFLDLQKAEAQAREAMIETALEKVRSRSLTMHKSEEIIEVVKSVFERLNELKIELNTAFIIIFKEGTRDTEWWLINRDDQRYASIFVKYADLLIFRKQFEAKEQGKELFATTYYGEDKKELFHYLFTQTDFKYAPPERQKYIFETDAVSISMGITKKIAIQITRHNEISFSQENNEIILRFTKVFDQAYTRFLDLQKAEAQAREAQIEAALEKVRSSSLAMHKSDHLRDVVIAVLEQLQYLGFAMEGGAAHIGIFRESSKEFIQWSADVLLKKVDSFKIPYNDYSVFADFLKARKAGKDFFFHKYSFEEKNSWFHWAFENTDFKNLPDEFKKFLLESDSYAHWSAFQKNSVITINNVLGKSLSLDQIEILKRFSKVFEQSYVRFLDLQKAEVQAEKAEMDLIEIKSARKKAEDALHLLQQTQKQLIQSEKMASLGELTAGIAHEIQNPLNFVNNFSEVNTELIDELQEEVSKGNYEEVKAIANGIKENEQKINHHGKRAGDIVKGMLQHSQKSTGVKEPTDINALADEYLRIAYHGLKAKDSSFHAELKTDFDPGIGKINIIPQDIGRVLLNLFNNAFYAVSERQKARGKEYEPTISVTTKKSKNSVIITVSDNGNGIPQNIVDKIFQPFFTTKPTGQGTGLGLSLSYDIVKAHGGEIKVESKEGEGTQFFIIIPA